MENNIQKKYVIVEDESDKHTLLALLRHIAHAEGVAVEDASFTHIHWEPRSSDPNIEVPSGLVRSIISPIQEVPSKMHKIAIVWDMDRFTEAERIQQCNNAIGMAIADIKSKKTDFDIEFVAPLAAAGHFATLTVNGVSVEIGAYFINHEGRGEMEDLLKAIKTKPSPIADCVDVLLPNCLEQHSQEPFSHKDLVKLWMNHYIRYDTLTSNQRKAEHTKWQNIMERRNDIFDFSMTGITGLDSLKQFLVRLCS